MTAFESSERFHRPDDLRVLRRNRRQIQAEQILAIAGRLLFALVLVILSFWIVQRVRQGPRFAVKTIQLSGVQHTSPADLQRLTAAYQGRNLFELNLEQIQNDVRKLPWVETASIQKQLPSTLMISVVERKPVALANSGGPLRYVDARGRTFADLSPEVGNPDLPLINAAGRDLLDCVGLLADLQKTHPTLYSRISEIAPAADNGFAIFDRDLKTTIYARPETIAEKWLTLYSIASVEKFRTIHPVQYVDLRFADRIIVKPVESVSVLRSPLSEATVRTTENGQRKTENG